MKKLLTGVGVDVKEGVFDQRFTARRRDASADGNTNRVMLCDGTVMKVFEEVDDASLSRVIAFSDDLRRVRNA